jgi:hypothetical protein
MKKTLKTLAIAMLITGATATAVKAQVAPYAVHNVSLNWTLYLPDTSTTNAKNGTITDTYKTEAYNTASYIKDLGNAMGQKFKAGAMLVAVSELAPGTNLTDGSNVVATFYSYTNAATNSTYTNTTETVKITNAPPLTNYDGLTNGLVSNGVTNNWVSIATNIQTNFVYQITNSIIISTNVTYYVKEGKTLIPVTNSSFLSDSAFLGTNDYDPATPLLSSTFLKSNTNNVFYNAAQNYTNGDGIFKGTIKTNLAITGTEFTTGEFNIDAVVSGTPAAAGASLYIEGSGNATAVTANVGKGKAALPWSTWNVTLTGSGGGSVDGQYITIATNTVITLGTNGLPIATNVNVNYTSTNATNVRLTGSVTHTFTGIVQ